MHISITSTSSDIDYGFDFIDLNDQKESLSCLLSTIIVLSKNNNLQDRFGKLVIIKHDYNLFVSGTLKNEEDFPILRGIFKNFIIARGYDIV